MQSQIFAKINSFSVCRPVPDLLFPARGIWFDTPEGDRISRSALCSVTANATTNISGEKCWNQCDMCSNYAMPKCNGCQTKSSNSNCQKFDSFRFTGYPFSEVPWPTTMCPRDKSVNRDQRLCHTSHNRSILSCKFCVFSACSKPWLCHL